MTPENTEQFTYINRDKIYINNPKWLLFYTIRKLIETKKETEFYNSVQLANLIFGHSKYKDIIKTMLTVYKKEFFKTKGMLCKPNLEALKRGHPEIFTNVKNDLQTHQSQKLDISLFHKSLEDEINEAKKSKNNKYITLKDVKLVHQSPYIYIAKIEKDDDETIQLPEGVRVICVDGTYRKNVTILEYNQLFEKVTFECANPLLSKDVKLKQDVSFILHKLKDILNDMNISSLIDRINTIHKTEFKNELITLDLDKNQCEVLMHALNYSTTYIWGPPGTGKSHLLATLILNLSLAKERTLVCSIANVAVNSLTHKYLERVEYYKKINSNYTLKWGECIRIGHVSDDKLRENDLIFPEENLYLIFLREKLNKLIKLRKKYEDLNDENEKAKVISQINENEIKIMEELRKHIHNAYVVFSTSSRAILDNNLGNCQFDNIIIDECSMMAIPNLLAMLKRISKRVIIAGDFRQLGPIALSSTTASEMWLHNDLFCLVDPDQSKLSKYDCVKMLKTQWRSNKDIIEYSNKYFYQSNLVTKPGIGGEKAFPVIQKNLRVEFIDLTLNSEYKCERTKSQSRRNLLSAQATFSLLKELRNASDIKNVGVITPYNGQCSYYKRFISENRMLFPDFDIKVGTVHTFQGSECDVIIFDMVDSIYNKHNEKIPIGNLYYRKSGEKLVNVAFSRAIRKLIIVGCSRVLFEGEKSEQISPLTRELMKDLINHVRNCPSINISDKNIGYQEDDAIKPLSYYLKK